MTRGRQANVAYVATDEAHLEEHQHTPGYEDEVTARTILYGVLQHEGAEKSAHETIEAEQEKWSSITQLAAEYETIAQAAQHQRFAAVVAASGLDTDEAGTVVGGESFGSLVAQLRRTEAEGHQPEQLLSRAVRAGGLDDAKDPAAVLAARLAKLAAARSGGTRPRCRPRYVAGLIPEASGNMPSDMAQTLGELAELIEQRASVVARRPCPASSLGAAGPLYCRLPRPLQHYRPRSAWTRAQRSGSTARLPTRRHRHPQDTGHSQRAGPAAARSRTANRLRSRPEPITRPDQRCRVAYLGLSGPAVPSGCRGTRSLRYRRRAYGSRSVR
jgi:hypothetical protein